MKITFRGMHSVTLAFSCRYGWSAGWTIGCSWATKGGRCAWHVWDMSHHMSYNASAKATPSTDV